MQYNISRMRRRTPERTHGHIIWPLGEYCRPPLGALGGLREIYNAADWASDIYCNRHGAVYRAFHDSLYSVATIRAGLQRTIWEIRPSRLARTRRPDLVRLDAGDES